MPFCATNVADFVNTAPADDEAILANAAEDPVRGPDALYTQVFIGIPAKVVAIDTSPIFAVQCSTTVLRKKI